MAVRRKKRHLKLPGLNVNSTRPECARAMQILLVAHESADALLIAYDLTRGERGRPRGMTTDKEQDLLRSMLVMAAGGLDAATKQLIRDTLAILTWCDPKSSNSFEKFVARRIQQESSSSGMLVGVKLIAAALVSTSPMDRLALEYVSYLTDGSLQSAESLFEVAAALGVDPVEAQLNDPSWKELFAVRNKIIHEVDINLDAHLRKRNVRSQKTMSEYSMRLFTLGAAFIESVDKRLTGVPILPESGGK